MKRIEIWFNNGLFRAYPKVVDYKFDDTDRRMAMTFGEHKHTAFVNLENVNFIEVMDDED